MHRSFWHLNNEENKSAFVESVKSNGGDFLCENHSKFHESMNYDEKERLMIAHYFGLLAENNFTEYDILGFLMVLRRELDKEKYKYRIGK